MHSGAVVPHIPRADPGDCTAQPDAGQVINLQRGPDKKHPPDEHSVLLEEALEPLGVTGDSHELKMDQGGGGDDSQGPELEEVTTKTVQAIHQQRAHTSVKQVEIVHVQDD